MERRNVLKHRGSTRSRGDLRIGAIKEGFVKTNTRRSE